MSVQESGEGQGGYAKEMSKQFIEAEVRISEETAARLVSDLPVRHVTTCF